MFCPQCGTESSSDLQYCRSCGANLKVIGKAVSLSEAIARSDRGPLPKIKEMMKSLKMEQVSDEISGALEQMKQEMMRDSGSLAKIKTWGSERLEKKEKTARQRREGHIVHGVVSLFSGVGLMIFLYFLSAALVLKLPPDIVAQAPFEIPSVVHVIWLVGLIPALTGIGRILAGLTIRSEAIAPIEIPKSPETNELPPSYGHASVTERTTNLLSKS
ncbi:MAG: hypothetical protein QOF62_1980 [Pyrinomonadaceae bacterium]|jgi:hypothetical protein|nr:hypothetical protein [Pyrinomonadaceae bacterium]